MFTKATLSVLGLYNYDPDLFALMQIPEDLDGDVLVENILMECAELETIYPDPNFMKFAINSWSKKELPVWEKLSDLWAIDLAAADEYDFERKRTPDLKLTKTGTETDTQTGNITDSGNNDRTADLTVTGSVSAYNASTFENRDKTTTSGTDKYAIGNTRTFNSVATAKTFNNRQDAETGNETITEKGRKKPLYELVSGASDIAVNNIYDYITDSFKKRFCILVY